MVGYPSATFFPKGSFGKASVIYFLLTIALTTAVVNLVIIHFLYIPAVRIYICLLCSYLP